MSQAAMTPAGLRFMNLTTQQPTANETGKHMSLEKNNPAKIIGGSFFGGFLGLFGKFAYCRDYPFPTWDVS